MRGSVSDPLAHSSHHAARPGKPSQTSFRIVGVAAEEYAKAIDEHRSVISKDEFDETYGFLNRRQQVATRLMVTTPLGLRAILDQQMIAGWAQENRRQ